jgi:hypothetical protein
MLKESKEFAVIETNMEMIEKIEKELSEKEEVHKAFAL